MYIKDLYMEARPQQAWARALQGKRPQNIYIGIIKKLIVKNALSLN